MAISAPSRVVCLDASNSIVSSRESAGWPSQWSNYSSVSKWPYPIIQVSWTMVKAPSYFAQTRGRKYNNVCHARKDLAGGAQQLGVDAICTNGHRVTPNYGYSSYSPKEDHMFLCIGNITVEVKVTYQYVRFHNKPRYTAKYVRVGVGRAVPYNSSYATVTCSQLCTVTLSWDLETEWFQASTTYPWGYSIVEPLREALKAFNNDPTKNPPEYHSSNQLYFMSYYERLLLPSLHELAYFALLEPAFSERRKMYECTPMGETVPLDSAFLFNENETKFNDVPAIIFGRQGSIAASELEEHCQKALLGAIDELPKFNDNSISNLLELCGFIGNLVINHRVEIPDSLSSLWLAYRYQATTSALDAEEAISFVHRHMDLGTLDQVLKQTSTQRFTYRGVDVTVRCTLRISPKSVSKVQEVWRALYTYGLQPDFYVIWDMIPYSFIVDWFLPVGDLAHVLDVERMYFSGVYYDIKPIIYSVKYTNTLVSPPVSCYTRWVEDSPPNLNWFYLLEPDKNPSRKTIGKRVIDAAALIFH